MAFKDRILRRPRGDAATPAAGAPGDPADASALPAADPVPASTDAAPAPDGATVIMPPVDPDAQPLVPPGRPGFRQRGRMRRRLRYLREVRELGYRDLGGLVFDQHRFGRPNEALVQGKVNAIDAIDRESRALGAALEDRAAYSELRVAGVSACQRCGGLHGSDARFCPSCGLAFGGPRTVAGVWSDHPLAHAEAAHAETLPAAGGTPEPSAPADEPVAADPPAHQTPDPPAPDPEPAPADRAP